VFLNIHRLVTTDLGLKDRPRFFISDTRNIKHEAVTEKSHSGWR
jgi:hypothetical protein